MKPSKILGHIKGISHRQSSGKIKEIEDIIQEYGQGMHDFHINDEILIWLRDGGSIQVCDTKFNM